MVRRKRLVSYVKYTSSVVCAIEAVLGLGGAKLGGGWTCVGVDLSGGGPEWEWWSVWWWDFSVGWWNFFQRLRGGIFFGGGGIFFSKIEGWNFFWWWWWNFFAEIEGGNFFSEIEGCNFFFRD